MFPKIKAIMDTEDGKRAGILVDRLFENTTTGLFQTFRNWLYVPTLRNKDGIEGINLGGHQLVELWLLGHELSAPSLQNTAMDHLFAKHHAEKHTGIWDTALVWERTQEDSALRRAWIHLLLSNDRSRRFEMISDPCLRFWTKESLADYMKADMKSLPHGLPMQDSSDLHVK